MQNKVYFSCISDFNFISLQCHPEDKINCHPEEQSDEGSR